MSKIILQASEMLYCLNCEPFYCEKYAIAKWVNCAIILTTNQLEFFNMIFKRIATVAKLFNHIIREGIARCFGKLSVRSRHPKEPILDKFYFVFFILLFTLTTKLYVQYYLIMKLMSFVIFSTKPIIASYANLYGQIDCFLFQNDQFTDQQQSKGQNRNRTQKPFL